VRLKFAKRLSWLVAAVWLGALCVPRAAAQNAETLMPEASAAKAKQILRDLIAALGGAAYSEIKESACEGRLARFGHSGELTGYTNFKVYWQYPDKNRTDYAKKGVIINVYNADRGWTLDRGGVTELPAPEVADFQEQAKRDINNLLRMRINEPGMVFRYAGADIVDLKTIDWVEIVDSEQRNFRLAVDHSSHLLVRSIVTIKDDTRQDLSVLTNIYTNFQLMEGAYTPLQITSDRDGRRVSQVFFTSCKYNAGFPADFFTKAALEKRFSEVGSKKYKDEKKKEKEEQN
jgi:outer membrane lipoprotein-sorting protein